jgi:hypothetical protein
MLARLRGYKPSTVAPALEREPGRRRKKRETTKSVGSDGMDTSRRRMGDRDMY